jgi:aspartyl-tRNA(Asn)/glutamyl-tRNA(Gln) amidotransferase subunit C
MIQQDDIRHMAKLARLQLDESEIPLYTEQVGKVLNFFDDLKHVDTSGIVPTAHPMKVSNAFREDVLKPSFTNEQALANAPMAEAPYFMVPQILER